MDKDVEFSGLVGKTLVSVENFDDERIEFATNDGETYSLVHFQDCCESVTVDDICGELSDLIGSPILLAEEVTNQGGNPAGVEKREYQDESWRWTFYKLSTNKGSVTIRWYGESNGYYSESVDFVRSEF